MFIFILHTIHNQSTQTNELDFFGKAELNKHRIAFQKNPSSCKRNLRKKESPPTSHPPPPPPPSSPFVPSTAALLSPTPHLHLLLLVLTGFARRAGWEQKNFPLLRFLPSREASARKRSSSAGQTLFSSQCGGWKEVYHDSWRSVVMKAACGVR